MYGVGDSVVEKGSRYIKPNVNPRVFTGAKIEIGEPKEIIRERAIFLRKRY